MSAGDVVTGGEGEEVGVAPAPAAPRPPTGALGVVLIAVTPAPRRELPLAGRLAPAPGLALARCLPLARELLMGRRLLLARIIPRARGLPGPGTEPGRLPVLAGGLPEVVPDREVPVAGRLSLAGGPPR